jgi:hypothetical protein
MKVVIRYEAGRVDGHLRMEGDDYRSCRGGALFGRIYESRGRIDVSETYGGTGLERRRENQEMAGAEEESDRQNGTDDQCCSPLDPATGNYTCTRGVTINYPRLGSYFTRPCETDNDCGTATANSTSSLLLWRQSCLSSSLLSFCSRFNPFHRKSLKVADLREICTRANVPTTTRSTKGDLVTKILASQPAIDAYIAKYQPNGIPPPPSKPTVPSTNDDLVSDARVSTTRLV